MKSKKFNLVVLAEISICAALGYVLDLIAGAYSSILPFANGGSIGIAMIAVFVVSFRRGPLAGFLTGLIMGLLDLLDGFYSISDAWWKIALQLSFDYILAYASCFVAGFFKPLFNREKNKNKKALYLGLGAFCGGLLKFICHYISGILFWPEFPGQNVGGRFVYSLVYNGGYMFPNIILCVIILVVIYLLQPSLLLDNYKEENLNEANN